MRIDHKASINIVSPLQECKLKWFLVKIRELLELRWIPVSILRHCDVLDGKDTLGFKRGTVVKRRGVSGVVTRKEKEVVRLLVIGPQDRIKWLEAVD